MEQNNQETTSAQGSPKYWLSLDQWRNDPEFQKLAEKEFLSSPLQSDEGNDGWARREFLKLMGASLALTSFGCVRRPAQKIVPYVSRPHEIVPGIANFYASSFNDGAESFGVVVTTREGRPLKVEGNPKHPMNRGGMSARAHAHILRLYDPDRLNGPRRNLLNDEKTNRETVSVAWDVLDKEVAEKLTEGGVALITGSINSPSSQALIREFTSTFNVRHVVYDAISYESLRQSQQTCYGRAIVPRYRLDQAQLIVSVDADILGTYLNPVEQMKDFASGRKPDGSMNKLVVFESLLSLTGTNADERYRIKPSQRLDVLMGLAYELVVKRGRSVYAGNDDIRRTLSSYKDVTSRLHLPENLLSDLAEQLWSLRGESLIIAGGMESASSLDLHIAANFLNTVLSNDGRTVDHSQTPFKGFESNAKEMDALIRGLNEGRIKTVVVHKSNPVYTMPSSSGFVEALKKAELVIYTGDRNDETGQIANFIATDHHEMENWGDMEPQEGLYSVQQPTIRPLYNTRAFEDSLIAWSKKAGRGSLRQTDSWYDYLRSFWRNQIFNSHRNLVQGDFESFWTKLLQEGVFDTKEHRRAAHSPVRNFDVRTVLGIRRALASEQMELVLYPTVGLKDGSLANVSWLQEFPDPVTKICWDNYLTMSPQDAENLKLREGQIVRLAVGGKTLEVPVHIQVGQAKGVLGLAVGYGHKAAGTVANGVGVNAYELSEYKEGRVLASGLPAHVEVTSRSYSLANVQGHHSMEGRQIVVEATLEQYKKNPAANIHKHKIFSMWSEHKYPENKWGMTIDLNTCTGCSACVVACQSENNIPTVGKRYVLQGREMHWIRVDRYYVGEPENPDTVFQPLVCMHCDNAPCETVCPVLATVHSDEGTNDMIYNRCVGTRYCANNCPYKVRRFNWFNYVKDVRKPLNMALNPEVTVRSRGVMEKCTFCIHRIRGEKAKARNEKRELKDGDIKTACQQSCPTNAIIFGDLNDPESEVSKVFKAQNSYGLLEEFNTQPAVRYRTKIRNTAQLKGDHGHNSHGEGHHS